MSSEYVYKNANLTDFKPLLENVPKNITRLDLSCNLVSLIVDDTFTNFSHLTILLLNNNHIVNFGIAFKPLISLTVLNLSFNKIIFIYEYSFKYNVNLRELAINSNPIVNIHRKSFRKLTKLTHLRINGTFLNYLPFGLFKTNSMLIILTLRMSINKISLDTFNFLCNLKELDLAYNGLQITDFSRYIFAGLINLEIINLENNFLSDLSSVCFLDNPNLKSLFLNFNYIYKVHDDFFARLPRLNVLNLQGNHPSLKIESKLFENNKQLQTLYLGYCSLVIGNLFINIINLDYCANCCPILSALNFPEFVFTPKPNSLKNLFIHHGFNGVIKSLHFVNLTSLVSLNLSDNNISFLNTFTFANLINLKNLVLDHNNLMNLHEPLFSTNNTLMYLSLIRAKISNILGSFFINLRNLSVLKLSDNKLNGVDDNTFILLVNLEYLFLDNCRLSVLDPQLLVNNVRLIEIHLENNFFNNLDVAMFSNLSRLRKIYYWDLSRLTGSSGNSNVEFIKVSYTHHY